MLMSNRCHLKNMTRAELLKAGEEPIERGGYFICKGSEKVIYLEDITCQSLIIPGHSSFNRKSSQLPHCIGQKDIQGERKTFL